MKNRHEIKTIADVMRVVNDENIEDFLKDFEGFLRFSLLTQAVAASVSGEYTSSFVWIDDGEHNVRIILQSEPEAKEGED